MSSFAASKLLSLQSARGNISWTKFARFMSERRKFYDEARICHSDGGFEINLDERKLRSPLGKILKIPNEGLAHAVSVEFNQQSDNIKTNLMPLTALCYAAADCSSNRNPDILAAATLKFLHTDTVLFHLDEPEDLVKLQEERWGGLVRDFNKRHDVFIQNTTGFGKPTISENTNLVLTNHLKSFNPWSLVGIEMLANALKSVIIPLTLMDRQITVEDAVSLSRLEQEFQISKWGNVEWAHDMELLHTRMKTAACATFVQLCSEDSSVRRIDKKTRSSP